MANTYTQIYIHTIFAVRGRQNVIRREIREELHRYISGIVRNKKQKVLAVSSMSDHIHLLIGLRPDIALSDLVRDIKANSSRFINDKRWTKGRFNWQEGFGAFSYSHSQLGTVIKYIEDQEKHHIKKSFKEEYLELLQSFNIEYDNKFVFEWI